MAKRRKDGRYKLTPAMERRIMAAVKKGETLASIATWAGVTKQRVHQVVRRLDPGHVFQRPVVGHRPLRERCGAPCDICSEPVCQPRYTYCSGDCAAVGRLWKELTQYRGARARRMAKWTLANSQDPVQRRYARRVLKGKVGRRRWIMVGSKTHRMLEEKGLLGKLPAGIEIRQPRA